MAAFCSWGAASPETVDPPGPSLSADASNSCCCAGTGLLGRRRMLIMPTTGEHCWFAVAVISTSSCWPALASEALGCCLQLPAWCSLLLMMILLLCFFCATGGAAAAKCSKGQLCRRWTSHWRRWHLCKTTHTSFHCIQRPLHDVSSCVAASIAGAWHS